MAQKKSSERLVRDIKRNTRRKFSSKEIIRIVIDGLRGETSIAELCRREGIPCMRFRAGKSLWTNWIFQANLIFWRKINFCFAG